MKINLSRLKTFSFVAAIDNYILIEIGNKILLWPVDL